MNLTHLVATALAVAGFEYVCAHAALAVPERESLEVVFVDGSAFVCTGCKSSYTDNMEAGGDTYLCPNGDQWSFSVDSPTTQDAKCEPAFYICLQGGACIFSRTGTLSATGGGTGECPIYYRVDDENDYHAGGDGQKFTIDAAVTCQAGIPGNQDCVFKTIEFYDSTSENNAVEMSWDVDFCCSKCPN